MQRGDCRNQTVIIMTKKTAPKKTAKKISKSTPTKSAIKVSKSKALPKAKIARKVAVKKSAKKQTAKTTNKKNLKPVKKPAQAKKTAPKKVAPAKKAKAKNTAKTKVKAASVSKKQKPAAAKEKTGKKPVAKSAKKAQIPAKKTPIAKKTQKTTQKTTQKHSDLKKLRASVNAKATPKKIAAAKKTQKAVVKSTKPNVKKIEISKKQPSKPAKKTAKTAEKTNSKTEKSKTVKPVKPEKVAKTKQPKAAEKAPKAKVSNKKQPAPVAAPKSEEAPVVMHKVKTQHLRPSHNIYFSIEDLNAFFEKKDYNFNQSQREKSTAKVKSAPVAAKPAVAPAVPKQPLAVATVFDILGLNPVVAETHEKLEEKDVPRKWKKYYNMLVDLRKHHSTGVEQRSEEVLKRSAKEDAGDLSSYGQHLADAGSESFERDMAYNLISNQKEILAEIEEAIKRIKNGTYGICEVTGQPIPESRLSSIPYTRCTKEGQEIKEREAKRIKASQRSSLYDMGDASASGSSSGGNSDEESGS